MSVLFVAWCSNPLGLCSHLTLHSALLPVPCFQHHFITRQSMMKRDLEKTAEAPAHHRMWSDAFGYRKTQRENAAAGVCTLEQDKNEM